MSNPSLNDYEKLLLECKNALKSLQGSEPGNREPINTANDVIADINKLLDIDTPLSESITLSQEDDEVWVKAEDLNTRVYRTDGGVVVDIWRNGDDESEPVASTYEWFSGVPIRF